MAEPQESVDDFAVLLAKARQGDERALGQLAQQYESEVRMVARVLLGPALRPYLDSVDILQSVHRSLMVGIRANKFEFAEPSNLVALALTMVRRKVARQWRRLQRQQRLSHGPADSANVPQLLAGLNSPQGDPADAAQYTEAIRQLRNHLDATEQRVIDLRLQGHTTAEVARELGLDPDVLRVRLHRLRQRLRATGAFTEWL